MTEKPLLIFPEPQSTSRHKLPPPLSRPHFPSPTRQVERLEPQLAQLEKAFSAQRAELHLGVPGIEPEKVLVFETVGLVKDFIKALKGIEGLEWLAEQNEYDIPADEDFYYSQEGGKANLSGRLYLIMSNQEGLRQLLSLWAIFQSNPNAPQFQRGRTKWRELFKQLKNIRHWNTEDRLRETGLLEMWQERVQLSEETINVEFELWYREKPTERIKAQSIIKELVEEIDGQIISSAVVEGIAYHGMLAALPIQAVETILHNPQIHLAQNDQIMFFKPTGQSISVIPQDEPTTLPDTTKLPKKPIGEPVVALFDGLPLANHRRLAGYLIVDDPDELESKNYLAKDRVHGTAMASLIINGELDAEENTLSRPIYTRPILQPGHLDLQGNRRECLPSNILFVDLVHRAVRRLFEEESGSPIAPKIKIINLSIGVQPFDINLSSLAKLIDYLAWQYNVLFVISAGNYSKNIELDVARNEFSQLTTDRKQLETEFLKSINKEARFNRLLSPSEAINGLTVGAVHEDSSTITNLIRRINPYISLGLPSPINAQGPGFRRAIKPDILLPGGKLTYSEKLGTTLKVTLEPPRVSMASVPPGQKVASPGTTPGDLNAARYTCGTSNATALATRTAALLYEKLLELKNEPGGEYLDDSYFAVLLKALLVHGASWNDASNLIGKSLDKYDKENIARLLGYGQTQPNRLFSCTEQRATLLGFGQLSNNQAHLYNIPIPNSINGEKVWRKLTVTLAWLTPTNIKHSAYRRAALWFTPFGINSSDCHFEQILQVKRQEADSRAVVRGTVQHEIFEGDKATAFESDSNLKIQINCRADAGDLTQAVPYGLVFTFEIAENLNLPIYQEIATRIRPAIEINN